MSKNSILKKLALIAAGTMILPAFAAADIKMGIIWALPAQLNP